MLEFVMENGGVTFPVVAPTPIPPTPTPMPPNGCLHEGTANGRSVCRTMATPVLPP